MSAATIVPSLLPLFVVIAMRRAETRIHRQLVEARVFTTESAIDLATGRSFARRRLEALVRAGAVRCTADSRHFLDEKGWADFQRARGRREALAAGVVLALLGVAVVVFSIMQ